MKSKSVKAWCLKHHSDGLLPDWTKSRKAGISFDLEMHDKQFRKQVRIVRVIITQVKKKETTPND